MSEFGVGHAGYLEDSFDDEIKSTHSSSCIQSPDNHFTSLDSSNLLLKLVADVESLKQRVTELERENLVLREQILMIMSHTLMGGNVVGNESRKDAVAESTSTDEDIDFKKKSRVIAAVPAEDTGNPTAALINFSKHYLNYQPVFTVTQVHEPSESGATDLALWFQVQVNFFDENIGTGKHRRKVSAREIATKEAIKRLNRDKEFLDWVIVQAFNKPTKNSP